MDISGLGRLDYRGFAWYLTRGGAQELSKIAELQYRHGGFHFSGRRHGLFPFRNHYASSREVDWLESQQAPGKPISFPLAVSRSRREFAGSPQYSPSTSQPRHCPAIRSNNVYTSADEHRPVAIA